MVKLAQESYNSRMTNPYFEVVLAALIWGSAGIFVKILNLPSTTVTFFRLSIPTIILLIYLLHKHSPMLKQINKLILFASFINALRMLFYFLAYSLTSIGNAVVMLYTWPLFAVLFSAISLKERITRTKILLLVFTFIGIVLMFTNNQFSFKSKDFLGMGSMLLSSALYAFTIPIFKKQLAKYTKPETIFYQNVVGAIVFLPFLFFNKPFPSLSQTVIVSIYSFLIGFIGFMLFFAGLKKIKASTASLLSYAEVVSAVILAAIFFRETVTFAMLIGGAIILTVSYFVRKTD